MAIVIPDSSKQTFLRLIVGHFPQETFVLRLFVNDVTPSNTDGLTTYVEMTQGDYAPVNLDANTWTFTGTPPMEGTHPLVSFIINGAKNTTIYGYYVTAISGRLLWSERFSTPFLVEADGDDLKITPTLRLTD